VCKEAAFNHKSMDKPRSRLEQDLHTKLSARKTKSIFRQLTTSPPNSADFSSNDFLSLSTSPVLRAAFLAELKKHHDTFPLGSGGSRLLDGNSRYADALEAEIAKFHGAESGLLWNSGFDANSGVFACVPQPGDIIIHDELIHASVHDGMRLSRAAKCLPFRHNDIEDLRDIIIQELNEEPLLKTGQRNIFIAVESVYSMDGDLAPLEEIVQLKTKILPLGNGHIIIDEAHGTGVLGPLGKGLVSSLNLEKDIFIRLHTFGKSLACSGAITLCSPLVRSYLINYARPLIYTTFLPFPLLTAIKASYSLLGSGHTTQLLANLHSLVSRFHMSLLRTIEFRNADHILQVSDACPKSPIFALQTQDPRELAAYCQKSGFVVRAVVPPTVPTRRVRVCLHAGNTVEEVDGLVKRVDEWLVLKVGQAQQQMELTKARL
jgi:8-amino-7-oxononanoate synthase